MSDLDAFLEDDTAERPNLAWYAQAAGVFGAGICAIGALFVLALTGGWAAFDAGAAPRAAADLREGQYYEQRWINPESGRPFAVQIDEISSAFAELGGDEGYEDIGFTELLDGEAIVEAPRWEPDDAVSYDEPARDASAWTEPKPMADEKA